MLIKHKIRTFLVLLTQESPIASEIELNEIVKLITGSKKSEVRLDRLLDKDDAMRLLQLLDHPEELVRKKSLILLTLVALSN